MFLPPLRVGQLPSTPIVRGSRNLIRTRVNEGQSHGSLPGWPYLQRGQVALSRPPADLNPMGRSDAAYIMNGIGATFTPEMARAVQAYLAYAAEAARPHATGANYVNLMDLDGASPERMKAAYSAEDWGRLVELKDRRDPGNVFRFNRTIPPSTAGGANGTRSADPTT